MCERLLEHGVLCKDTHERTVRIAPPLTVLPERARLGAGADRDRARRTRVSPAFALTHLTRMPSTALRRRDRKAGAPGGGEDPARSSAASAIAGAGDRLAALPGSWLLVAGAVVWNLINLRAETWAVSYLDDSSLHEQMVRFATTQLRAGHLPLTSWFPFLGEGSPHFLHYQSLPAMLTGAVGLVTGSNVAFRWSLYLLWCLWPISVYLAGRLFGFGKWPSALAAAMAPFLMSPIAVGYEQKAYIWVGYGVWAQLWASWTLPLAWGFSWRAIRGEGRLLAAVVFVSLTTALHYETGIPGVPAVAAVAVRRPRRAPPPHCPSGGDRRWIAARVRLGDRAADRSTSVGGDERVAPADTPGQRLRGGQDARAGSSPGGCSTTGASRSSPCSPPSGSRSRSHPGAARSPTAPSCSCSSAACC